MWQLNHIQTCGAEGGPKRVRPCEALDAVLVTGSALRPPVAAVLASDYAVAALHAEEKCMGRASLAESDQRAAFMAASFALTVYWGSKPSMRPSTMSPMARSPNDPAPVRRRSPRFNGVRALASATCCGMENFMMEVLSRATTSPFTLQMSVSAWGSLISAALMNFPTGLNEAWHLFRVQEKPCFMDSKPRDFPVMSSTTQ
mmetsp:Transcript_69270/g.157139  ORF Transcript_69270/g.157139 Transcript_69270/m.157139 type:complete len:201 (-) Transcript_69270:869-1471(-)